MRPVGSLRRLVKHDRDWDLSVHASAWQWRKSDEIATSVVLWEAGSPVGPVQLPSLVSDRPALGTC
jgi:hypothetical protein